MKRNNIEEYLKNKNRQFDKSVLDAIKFYLKNAKTVQDEEQANYYWFLEQVYYVQSTYVCAFNHLIQGKYEESWNEYDHCDIAIANIDQNTPSGVDKNVYHLSFIGKMIKEYQKLFPYRYFFSRETIIKEEKCSICGKVIKLRNHCNHIPGKVYMGEMCCRIVTDMDFKAVAIVTDPFDKYTMIHPEGKEYNYGMLEYLLEVVSDPYEEFHVEMKKEKLNQFKNASRNGLCPCGSGKKYNRCHMGSTDELFDHYIICLDKQPRKDYSEVKLFNTWKS